MRSKNIVQKFRRRFKDWKFIQTMTPEATPQTTAIPLKEEKVLVVVAHADDEVIFFGSVLESSAKQIKVIYVHSVGHRQSALRKLKSGHSILTQELNIPEKDGSELHLLSTTDCDLLSTALSDAVEDFQPTKIFTHNLHGEYGNKQHTDISKAVIKFSEQSQFKGEVFLSAYAYPTIFGRDKKTQWPKTLKVFSSTEPWTGKSTQYVAPFSGIFSAKHSSGYHLMNTTHHLGQRDSAKRNALILVYKNIEDWWDDPDSRLGIYARSPIQYFQKIGTTSTYQSFAVPNYPRKHLDPNGRPKDDLRMFHDTYLLNSLHMSKCCLWIGWNEFCVKSGYYQRITHTADQLDLMDSSPIRSDKTIYGEQTANIICDCCDMSNKVTDDTYDFVHFFGVLEYVDNMQNAINEIVRITKSGGRILLGTPGLDWVDTGHNRPALDEVHEMIISAGGIIIQQWLHRAADFYILHIYKPDQYERKILNA